VLPPQFATELILPFREYLLCGFTAAVITFLLGGPVRVRALRLGAVAWPRGRDVHVTPTPRWGGVAMFLGVLAGVGMAYQLPALRLAFDSFEVIGVMAAAALLVLVGALDDKYDLDALTKFAGQITAAGVLVIFGVQLYVFWIPWGGGGPGPISGSILVLGTNQSAVLTVLLTVALVNAMNFVDGLDGLAAGIGMIAAAAIGLFALGLVQRVGNDPTAYSPALIAVVLAGACLGFLPHNFNPSRIFMGDSGSMLIGLLLAAATTSASGRMADTGLAGSTDFLGLFAPLVVLAAVGFVPLLDLLLAVVRRTRAGMSPFSPDKMHLHHRMLEIGHSHRRAVLLIYLWAGVLAFGAVALALVDDPPLVLWTTGAGLLVAVIATVVPRERRRTAARRAAETGAFPAQPPTRPRPVPPEPAQPVPPHPPVPRPGPAPGPVQRGMPQHFPPSLPRPIPPIPDGATRPVPQPAAQPASQPVSSPGPRPAPRPPPRRDAPGPGPSVR
jgi:UDP-GlcNAc:undecaprenyl-phosphate GlcNAc-1-phosphate transferase